MTRLSVLVLFLVPLASGHCAGGVGCDLGIRKFVSPDYPNVARLAQVSGDVHLAVKLADDGRVEAVDVRTGPPILASYARKNVLTWQFTCPQKRQEIEVVYRYYLRRPKVYGQVVPSVSLESPTEVVITSNLPLPSGDPK